MPRIDLPSSWVCNGTELKPRTAASSSNTWILTGREIKPKVGSTSFNTWIWDGKELKPKVGATSGNTWLISGNKAKPMVGATPFNTYEIRWTSHLGHCRKVSSTALVTCHYYNNLISHKEHKKVAFNYRRAIGAVAVAVGAVYRYWSSDKPGPKHSHSVKSLGSIIIWAQPDTSKITFH